MEGITDDVSDAVLGVIGGSGPGAGLNIVENILSIHKMQMGKNYKTDKDAVPVVLMQDPNIGGPHGVWDLEDIFGEAYRKILRSLQSSIEKLQMISVKCFCIACNTLHHLEPVIRRWMDEKKMNIEFISIINTTKEFINNHYKVSGKNGINGGWGQRTPMINGVVKNRISILGTLLITDLDGISPFKGLFSDDNNQMRCIQLNNDARQRLQNLISESKNVGITPVLQDTFFDFLMEQFIMDGHGAIDYLVLACTELPLLLKEENKSYLEGLGVIVIDPNIVLANKMLSVGRYLVN